MSNPTSSVQIGSSKPLGGPFLFSAFLMMFIVHDIQTGIGLAGFQKIIFAVTGHDAWISVIVAGLFAHLIVWIMFRTLYKFDSKDLFEIHQELLGKIAGNTLNVIYIMYLFSTSLAILRNYVEMVQVWLFPELQTWGLELILLGISLYAIKGGVRTIVGMSLIFIVITFWMNFLLAYPIQFATFNNILPIMNTSLPVIINGATKMSFTLLGFEIIYFVYPYVKEKKKAQIFSQFGLLYTNIQLTLIMLVSVTFFSPGELLRTDWATFTMLKIIKMPIIERFEFFGVSLWMLIILPNLVLYLWAATKGCKRVLGYQQKKVIIPCLGIVYVCSLFFESRTSMDLLNDTISQVGKYVAFVYPLILYALVKGKELWLKRRAS